MAHLIRSSDPVAPSVQHIIQQTVVSIPSGALPASGLNLSACPDPAMSVLLKTLGQISGTLSQEALHSAQSSRSSSRSQFKRRTCRRSPPSMKSLVKQVHDRSPGKGRGLILLQLLLRISVGPVRALLPPRRCPSPPLSSWWMSDTWPLCRSFPLFPRLGWCGIPSLPNCVSACQHLGG